MAAPLAGVADLLADFPVAVRHSAAQGRYVVAAEDLPAGAEVFCGWAPTASIFEAFHKRVCACCLAWGPTGSFSLCCRACHWAFYCSAACQECHAPLHLPWCAAHKRLTRADDKFGKGTAPMLRTLLEVAQFAVFATLPPTLQSQVQRALDRVRARQAARLPAVAGDVRAAYAARAAAAAADREAALRALVERHTGVALPAPAAPPPGSTDAPPASDGPPPPAFKLELPPELFHAVPRPTADAAGAEVWAQVQLLSHVPLPPHRVKEWQGPLQFLQSLVEAVGPDSFVFTDEQAEAGPDPGTATAPGEADGAPPPPAPPPLRLTAEAWLQLLARVDCNAFGIYNCLDPTVEDGLMVGRAVCPAASFFNHSCEPNCQRLVLCPNLIAIRTVVAVPAGTELSISYIDHNVPRSTRKAQLADLYGFACQCQLCGSQREEPKVTYKSHGKPQGGKPQGGRPPKSAKGTRR